MNINLVVTLSGIFTPDDPNLEPYPYTISKKFNCWQTSTAITRKILASEKPEQVYRDWILSVSEYSQELVYAEDDIWRENEPIGSESINEGLEHLKELDEFKRLYFHYIFEWFEM